MSQLPGTIIRVALVEDDPDEREKLLSLLNHSKEFVCVAACGSAEEALKLIPSKTPDVILMDINLPGISGIECTQQLQQKCPGTQIMMLTIFEDHARIFRALAAGASGYLLKKTPPQKLLEAIQEITSGGAPMSGQIARQVVAVFQTRPIAARNVSPLTQAEQKVLELLAKGFLYKEVADDLGVQISTVRTHIGRIYKKLHARNRTEAIQYGLIPRLFRSE